MQKLSKMKFVIFVSLLWLLPSCATPPPNVPACKHLPQRLWEDPETKRLELRASPACWKAIKEPECGYCVRIVDGGEIWIGEKMLYNNKPWSQIREEAIILPAEESYAPLSTHIINSCKRLNCSKDATRFKVKLDRLSEK